MKMRVVYASLIAVGFALYFIGSGIVGTILTAVAILMISSGLYLFMRYDLTTYTYILMENEGRQDFYIDRVVGSRGAYVCYYPLCDAVLLEKYEKDTKKRLIKEYQRLFVYNYCHNCMTGEKHILVFKNEGYYDAVIVELDKASLEYLKSKMNSI